VNPRDAQLYVRMGSFYAPSVMLSPNKTKVLKSNIKNAPIQGGGTLDLILFTDNTIGRKSEWFTVAQLQYMSANGEYSNLINQSLLDGLTENTSLLEAEGNEQYSNGVGDWFKGLFKKDEKKPEYVTAQTPFGNILLPKVEGESQVVDGKTLEQEFSKSSESKEGKSFKEWVKSDNSKRALNSALQVVNFLFAPKTKEGIASTQIPSQMPSEVQSKSDDKSEDKPVTILGMQPVTFAIVSVLTIGGVIGGIYLLRKK
jgi:hypothetical protein